MNRVRDKKLVKRVLLTVLVLLACVGCDQMTKSVARQSLVKSEAISLLNDTVRLQYVENTGVFMSLGANISENLRYWVFTLLMGFFLAGILVLLMTSPKIPKIQSIALSLMLGGGVGNLIDRIFNEGRVIDFMNLGIGSLRTGIFNVADIAILVGGIWLFCGHFNCLGSKQIHA